MNGPLTPRERSRQIREEIGGIRDYLENLGVGVGLTRATSARGANGVTVLRTPDGKLIAQLENPQLADFIKRAPVWLASLCTRIEQMERDGFELRRYRRRMRKVEEHLRNADGVGFATAVGKRHIEDALDALHEPDVDDDWR